MIPLYDTAPSARRPVVVFGLIGFNLLIFTWMLALPAREIEAVVVRFALIPLRYSDPAAAEAAGLDPGNYWPLLTNAFLHGGLLHILINMWTLWIFGPAMEARFGRGGFLALYVLGAIAASATHLITHWTSAQPMLGASGAVAAVIAAYAVNFPAAKVVLLLPLFFVPFFFPVSAIFFAGLWFMLQLLQGTVQLFAEGAGGVAWWAHIGGFGLGAVAGLAVRATGWSARAETRQWSERRSRRR